MGGVHSRALTVLDIVSARDWLLVALHHRFSLENTRNDPSIQSTLLSLFQRYDTSFEGLVQQEAAFAIARDLTLDSKWQHDDLVRFCQLFGPLESDSNNDATGPESLLFNYKLFIDFTFFPIERQPQRLRLKHQIATTGFLQVFPGELLSDVFAASMPRITTQRNKKGMTVVATRIGGADWSGQANDDSAIAKSSQVIVQLRMAVNTLRLFVHPNITYYLTTVQSDDALYLVHEAHESCTLKTILESFGVMKEPTIRRYLIQLLQALQYLHAHGIVHGNLSTQTVNIDSYGLLKVSEFGLASYLDQLSVQPRPEIIDGNDCDWTRQYPPPEIAKGASGCSMKSDMWCVGMLILQMANGFSKQQRYGNSYTFSITSPCYSSSTHQRGSPQKRAASSPNCVRSTQSPVLPTLPQTASKSLQKLVHACLRANPRKRGSIQQLLKMEFFQVDHAQATNEMLRTVCTDLDASMRRLISSSSSSPRVQSKHFIGTSSLSPGRKAGRSGSAGRSPSSKLYHTNSKRGHQFNY